MHPLEFVVNKRNSNSYIYIYIPGVPKKAERSIFSTLHSKSGIFFHIIRKSILRRRQWYQNHWIWFSTFHSTPIFVNAFIFNFRWILATFERRIWTPHASHMMLLCKPVDPCMDLDPCKQKIQLAHNGQRPAGMKPLDTCQAMKFLIQTSDIDENVCSFYFTYMT